MVRRLILGLVLLLLFAFVALQLVPYGRAHDSPRVGREPPWDSPGPRELAVRACFDCHGNESAWPRYSGIAPTSWLVQHPSRKGGRR